MDPWEKINRLRASAQKDKAIYSKTVIYSPTRTHRRIPYMHIKFERREYGVSDGTIYQRRTRYSNCLINHITFSLLKTCEKRASGAPAREGGEQRRGWGRVGWGGEAIVSPRRRQGDAESSPSKHSARSLSRSGHGGNPNYQDPLQVSVLSLPFPAGLDSL